MARKPKNPQIEQPSIEANNLCKVEFSERVKAALRRIFGLADDENTKVKLYKLEGAVSYFLTLESAMASHPKPSRKREACEADEKAVQAAIQAVERMLNIPNLLVNAVPDVEQRWPSVPGGRISKLREELRWLADEYRTAAAYYENQTNPTRRAPIHFIASFVANLSRERTGHLPNSAKLKGLMAEMFKTIKIGAPPPGLDSCKSILADLKLQGPSSR